MGLARAVQRQITAPALCTGGSWERGQQRGDPLQRGLVLARNVQRELPVVVRCLRGFWARGQYNADRCRLSSDSTRRVKRQPAFSVGLREGLRVVCKERSGRLQRRPALE